MPVVIHLMFDVSILSQRCSTLFHVQSNNVLTVQSFLNILPVANEVDVGTVKFLCKLAKSDNLVLRHLHNTCGRTLYDVLCHKYNYYPAMTSLSFERAVYLNVVCVLCYHIVFFCSAEYCPGVRVCVCVFACVCVGALLVCCLIHCSN